MRDVVLPGKAEMISKAEGREQAKRDELGQEENKIQK